MRKLSLFAVAVTAAFALAGPAKAVPLNGAAPLAAVADTAAQNPATAIQWRRHYRHRHWRPRYYGYYGYRPYYRPYGYYGYRPYRWHRHHYWRRYW